MYTIIVGTPIRGFKCDGLFNTVSEAEAFGEGKYPNIEWWAIGINLDKYYNTINHINDIIYDLLEDINENNIKDARIKTLVLAAEATKLYSELIEKASPSNVIMKDTISEPDLDTAPLPPSIPFTKPPPLDIIDDRKCITCGHTWGQHAQNVHRVWVCNQCNCRGMNPPL